MNTYPTQTIPTDRNGNVYYGPKTHAEGAQRIEEDREYEQDGESAAAEIIAMMEHAGYIRAASRLRKQFIG